ncbi:hypothetical protein KI387_011103, partial [Taxus chinensis]
MSTTMCSREKLELETMVLAVTAQVEIVVTDMVRVALELGMLLVAGIGGGAGDSGAGYGVEGSAYGVVSGSGV